MATIGKDPNGTRRILFVAPDGKRKTIRLGKVSQRTAEAVKVRVEHLAAAAITGHAPDDETARWVAGLDQTMADKLAAVGLIAKREIATLQAFLDNYMRKRSDVKPATLTVWHHTRRNLIEFFGPEKPLRDITKGMPRNGGWPLSRKSCRTARSASGADSRNSFLRLRSSTN